MNFDAASITMYINIGIGVLLFIAFIIGYVRGLFKSTFYVASAVGVVLLFLIFSPVIVKTIMTTDVSSYNIDFNGTTITTLSDLLKDLLVTNLNITSKDGLLLEETMVYKTAYSFIISCNIT